MLLEQMGKRSQPRKQVEIQVRIFGTDSDGHVFSEKVSTVNISRNGAELAGIRPELGLDEIQLRHSLCPIPILCEHLCPTDELACYPKPKTLRRGEEIVVV